jgi:hypothetical protein
LLAVVLILLASVLSADSLSAETPATGLAEAFPQPEPGAAAPDGAEAVALPGMVFRAVDSLAIGVEEQADARACLAGICWQVEPFEVTLAEAAAATEGDLRVRFPSPVTEGPACTDTVWLEWYQPRNADGNVPRGPACVVVHESGNGMTVGRIVARALAVHGVHSFMLQMPFYGARRPAEGRAGAAMLVPAVRQAVADVRRARDAVAVLPLVDPARISVQGTSLGGFVTATVAGLDAGYDKVFILLAGGDLVGVLEKGKQDAEHLRKSLAASGLTEARIKETLHAIEPTRLAHRYRPDRTWIFSARYDDVVPLAHCQLLADSAGLAADHHVVMEATHYSGIIYLPLVMAQIAAEIRGQETVALPASR